MTHLPAPLPGHRLYFQDEWTHLYQTHAERLLADLPDACAAAVVTDPPYSSGGLHRTDRAANTGTKYVLTGTKTQRPDFSGDNRDQRSFAKWLEYWLQDVLRILRPGGYCFLFTDWRQLPTVTDAVQMAGLVWRGVVVWDKVNGRPSKGWFRNQTEFIVLASAGGIGQEQEREVDHYAPGVLRHVVNPAEKHHQTGKPLNLMVDLLRVVPPGGLIVDPFAGSGTTLRAARRLGLPSIGSELTEEYCAISARLLAATELHLPEAVSAAPLAPQLFHEDEQPQTSPKT